MQVAPRMLNKISTEKEAEVTASWMNQNLEFSVSYLPNSPCKTQHFPNFFSPPRHPRSILNVIYRYRNNPAIGRFCLSRRSLVATPKTYVFANVIFAIDYFWIIDFFQREKAIDCKNIEVLAGVSYVWSTYPPIMGFCVSTNEKTKNDQWPMISRGTSGMFRALIFNRPNRFVSIRQILPCNNFIAPCHLISERLWIMHFCHSIWTYGDIQWIPLLVKASLYWT